MIKRQDISLNEGDAIILENGVSLIGSRQMGSRPGAISVRTSSSKIEVPVFTDGRFDPEASRLVPTCEVVLWKDNAFIVGLPSVVIAGGGVCSKCDLFRKPEDDGGFYKTEWLEAGDRIILIYEGGIAAWDESGETLWHEQKFWDDVFVRIDPIGLIFLRQDGKTMIIDPSNGCRKKPSDPIA